MKGIPAPLPEGERVLWQGTPDTLPFLKQVFHTRMVLTYVGILLGWSLISGATSGNMIGAIIGCAKFGGLAAAALVLLGGLAWLLARSTTYTITSARIIIEYGAAMEKTVQIPFTAIASADLTTRPDGTGDLVLTLVEDQKINYIMLWPHVRPWHMSVTEPSLRSIGNATSVAQLLGRALAASAGTVPVAIMQDAAIERDATVRAAA
jgi:hypothetical protein